MKNNVLILLSVILLSGCSTLDVPKSLKLDNAVKTTATTAVTYAVAGPVPAAANLLTSVAVDEVMPDKPNVPDIDPGNREQMWAYIWKDTSEGILYGLIALLAFSTVIAPWATQRRARRKRKYEQYKYEAKLAREQKGLK